MTAFRSVPRILVAAGLLALGTGCGSEPAKPVATNADLPQVQPPAPTPPAPTPQPQSPAPDTPKPPAEPVPAMPPPAPLPPDEPIGPGPMVMPVDPPMPSPPVGPVPNPPAVGPDPVPPPQPMDPNKPPEYPKFIIGRDFKEWLKEATTHKDPQYREAALKILPQFGPDVRKDLIKPLCAMILSQGTDPGVRGTAINIVTNLGFDFRIDDDRATREEKQKMADLRRETKQVTEALRHVMYTTSPGSPLRQYCVQSLAVFGVDAHSVVGTPQSSNGTLRQMATDPAWATRHAVALTLAAVGGAEKDGKPDPKGSPFDPATDVLLNILMKDNCAAVRVQAIQSLLILGPPKGVGPEYAKAIEKYLKPVVARLEKPSPPVPGGPPVPKVQLEDDNAVLVWLWLLHSVYEGSKLSDNLDKIIEQVKQPKDPGVRLQALTVLSWLGEPARPALPILKEALDKYEEPAILVAAMSAVASIGPKGGADALPELTALKNGKRDPKKPDNAPPGWKPDPTLRNLAADAIDVVTGKRKLTDVSKDPTKEKDPPESEPKKDGPPPDPKK